ncbi:hypothetical protein OEZ86_012374 [Tetradesmus obliquus]|nr:hypothetical protein OEZ86_012374 [Tetradesmus obliquus]
MALYIKRVETVVSFKQLAAEQPAAAPAGADIPVLEPDAPVSGIAFSRLPKYSYACDATPKVPRISSITDFARVPDMDDSSEGSGADAATGAGTAAGVVAAAALLQPGKASLASYASGSGADGGWQRFGLASDADETGSSCDGSIIDAGCVPVSSLLDSALLAMWEERAEQGLFRYDVTACPTKVVPGQYGFVAQLNEGRYSKKRPTEFRVDQVVQTFDPAKFNFTKAFKREVLFAFEPAARGAASSFEEGARCSASPSVVVINVSPIDYGHVLLCPRVLDCIPQVLAPDTCLAALHFALEVGNPYLRVGFNSLGAFATINHLHFQAYYLQAPMPCERAPTAPLARITPGGAAAGSAKRRRPDSGADSVLVSRLCDYPVRGWVVEGPSLAAMAAVVGEASQAMQAANIPHNMLIAECGSRVFLWPQRYAERQARGEVPEHLLDVGVNPAVWEISGHMVLKRAEDYENFTEAAAWELLAAVSLTEEQLAAAEAMLFGVHGAGRSSLDGGMAAFEGKAAAAAALEGAQGAEPMMV